jgi:hypothetical protein
VAGQVQQPVGIKLLVGEVAVLKLQDGAMPRPPIAAQGV